ncbi:MAG: FAD-dependent oxidoreductase [Pseudomonadota bacterium]|nr:FAD-dependent oxidoreductase [Pseudomonadota bacterium]
MSFMTVQPALSQLQISPASDTDNLRVVVIGGGPVGARAAGALADKGLSVTLLSTETFAPYNRVKLTPLLAGDVQFGQILAPEVSAPRANLDLRTGLRVTQILRDQHLVRTADGQLWPYDKLVIATGSRAFIPGIQGRDLPGVFTFRSAEDAQALLARSISARRIVVIGGGLLGLEAARGMQRRQAHVTVIEHEGRVMPRQLDTTAGALLGQKITDLGVDLRTGVAVRTIAGETRVEEVHLADGTILPCDTVIVCTGVRANTGLARDARLPFNRGIFVDDAMSTGDPDIYAIGECAEHNGVVHGLVGPGFEQADVAVDNILGGNKSYRGSLPATKLKVIGAEVFSIGPIEQLDDDPSVRSHVWEKDGVYRRIFLRTGRLVGAIAVGGWSQSSRVQSAIAQGANALPWMVFRFRRDGMLWSEDAEDISAMPDAATVCNCTGVSCGRLRDAMKAGANSVETLGQATGAGNVCGSCVPLLEELVSAGGPPKPVRLYRAILALSGFAAMAAMVLALAPRIPLPQSYDAESLRVWLWQDNITRQWTGFTLLGLTLAAMVIGLRKRLRITDRLGSFDGWRLAHIAIGAASAAALIIHTGLRAGSNLNMMLFMFFALTLVMGAVAGLATGGDHALRARRIGSARKPARRLPTWLHILAVWPLPVLILAHVLASYAF